MKKTFFVFLFCANIVFGQSVITKAEMDSLILPLVKDSVFSGCVLIGDTSKVIFKGAYGFANYELEVPNDTRFVFNVASITKQFTGAAILFLSLQSKLSLSDSISKYIPNFPNGANITIEHLLKHKSGIQTYNNFKNYDEFKLKRSELSQVIEWIKKHGVTGESDDKFEYSNSNYGLLAYIIEKVSGKTYPDFLKETFFKPANMTHTGNFSRTELIKGRTNNYEKTDKGLIVAPWFDYDFKYGSGSLQTSVEDMYNWFVALNKGVIYDSTFKDKFLTGEGISGGYGFGLGKNSFNFVKIAEHEGGIQGVQAYVVYSIDPAYFFMIVSNVTSDKTRDANKQIFKYVANKLF